MGLKDNDRLGKYIYYQCRDCKQKEWYHEKDVKVCMYCGSLNLEEAPPAKSEAEVEQRVKMSKLW